MNRHARLICILSITLLSACGGGGGGGGGAANVDPTLSGLAAVGAALGNATVTVKCTAGGSSTTTTAANGTFSLQLSSAQSLPCMLRAVSGATTLYGYATGFGRVNITPLSDLVLAAAGRDTPTNLFAGFNATLATTINSNLASAKAYVRTQITRLDLTPLAIDPLTGTFVVGDIHDQTLDQLQVALNDTTAPRSGKTLDDLRTLATTSAELNTVLPTGKLVISEVASGFYGDAPFWFEIANVGNVAVSLNGATVRVGQAILNVTPFTTSGRQSFNLPNVSVAPGAFLVVSGQNPSVPLNYQTPNRPLADTAQRVYISDSGVPSRVPFWSANGSIELINGGKTLSFVRFGSNTDAPTTGTAPTNAPALPNTANSYGNAIVLYGKTSADMDPAGAWTSVAWTTPAGPNDVPAGAVDADGDGIPDSAEVSGGTFAGLDLYAMGARTGKRDILIQVDYMNSADPGVIPQKAAFDKVKAAFAANNVNMIIDVGGLFLEPANSGYNWGGGKQVANANCVFLGAQPGCASDIYNYKNTSMDIRRASVFHYALFGNSLNPDGSGGSSGIAELPGNDFLVTLGGTGGTAWNLKTDTTPNLNRLVNFQAGTFMHELGHNLNLRHGGFEDAHRKPNYFSVMNYLYQLNGLGGDAKGLGPYQRWKCWATNNCAGMIRPADSTDMDIDYSNGSSADLNEASLLESFNIGRGANGGVYADWNLSGAQDFTPYVRDLNGSATTTILKDHDDWTNILWAFNRTISGTFGARQTANNESIPALDPMSNDRQPFIVETLHAPQH